MIKKIIPKKVKLSIEFNFKNDNIGYVNFYYLILVNNFIFVTFINYL